MTRKMKTDQKETMTPWERHLAQNPDFAAFCEADEAEERGDLSSAIRLFKRSAEMGCMQATARLGTIYDDVLCPPRPDLAVYWYKRGVRRGYEIAAQNLAMHYKMLGRKRWYVHWLRRAMELGHEDSRAELERLI